MPEQLTFDGTNQQFHEYDVDRDEGEHVYDSINDNAQNKRAGPTDIPNTWLNRLLPSTEPMEGTDWQSVFGRVFVLNDKGMFTPLEMERVLAGNLSDLQRLKGLPYNVGDILQQFTTLPLSRIHHYANTGEYLRALFDERKLVDVLIHVQDKVFAAHRVALACHSVYFARAFILNQHQKHKLTEVKLKNVDPHAFFAILRFIYTGQLSVTKKNVDMLINVANQLQIPALLYKCLDFLGHLPTKKIEEAEDVDPQIVNTQAEQLLRIHLLDLAQDETFLKARVEVVELILGDDDVLIDTELDVFYAVLAWLAYDLGPRRQHAERLMRQIRFTCMTPAEVIEATQASNIVRNSPYCRNRVLEAIWLMTIKGYDTYDVFNCRCPKPRSCLEGRGPQPPDNVETYMTYNEPLYENIREAEPVDYLEVPEFPNEVVMNGPAGVDPVYPADISYNQRAPDPVVFKPMSAAELSRNPNNQTYHPARIEPVSSVVTTNTFHNQMKPNPATGMLESIQQEDTSFNNPGTKDRKGLLEPSTESRMSGIYPANPEIHDNFSQYSDGESHQLPHPTTRDGTRQPNTCGDAYSVTTDYQSPRHTVYSSTAERDHQPATQRASKSSEQKGCQSPAAQSYQPTSEMGYYSAGYSKYRSVRERGYPLLTYAASGHQHCTDNVYRPSENGVPQTYTDPVQQQSTDTHHQPLSGQDTEQRSSHRATNRVSPSHSPANITMGKVDLSPESTKRSLVTFSGRESGCSTKYRSGNNVSVHLSNRVPNDSSRSENTAPLVKQQSLERVEQSNRSSSANPGVIPNNRCEGADPTLDPTDRRGSASPSVLPVDRRGHAHQSAASLDRHESGHQSVEAMNRQKNAHSPSITSMGRYGSARPSVASVGRYGSARPSVASMGRYGNARPSVASMGRYGNGRPSVASMGRYGNARPSITSMGRYGNTGPSVASMGRYGSARPSVASINRSGNTGPSVTSIHRHGIARRSLPVIREHLCASPSVVSIDRHRSASSFIVSNDRYGSVYPSVVPKGRHGSAYPSFTPRDRRGSAYSSGELLNKRGSAPPPTSPKNAMYSRGGRPSETNVGISRSPSTLRFAASQPVNSPSSFSRKQPDQMYGSHTVISSPASAFLNVPAVKQVSLTSLSSRQPTEPYYNKTPPRTPSGILSPRSPGLPRTYSLRPVRSSSRMSVLPVYGPTPPNSVLATPTTAWPPWFGQIPPPPAPPKPPPPPVPKDVPYLKLYTSQFSGEDLAGEMTGVEVGFRQQMTPVDCGHSPCVHCTSATCHFHDGDLLAVGGFMDPNNRSGSSQAQRLDCIHKKWEKFSEMPETRINFAAAFLNGKLVVCGGYDPSFCSIGPRATRDMFCFDSADQRWERGGSMLYARSFHTVCLMEGRLFALGGQDHEDRALRAVEVYDPGTDRWVLVCSMAYHRVGACAAGFRGRIMVVGGYGEPIDNVRWPVLFTTEWFEPEINRWRSRGDLRLPRAQACLVAVEPYLYLCGGVTPHPCTQILSSIPDIDRYDPRTDQWTHITDLQIARHNAGATTLGTQIYIVGGVSTDINRALRSVECYDIVTRSWNTTLPALPLGAKSIACVVVAN